MALIGQIPVAMGDAPTAGTFMVLCRSGPQSYDVTLRYLSCFKQKSGVIDMVGLINRIGVIPSNNKLSWHFKLTA
jgi:hypothetical protein